MRKQLIWIATGLATCICSAQANTWPGGGQPHIDLRLRYERAEQANALRDANALTTRLRLGYTTPALHGWSALLECEGVYASAGQDYNSAPGSLAASNGQSAFSLIPDPTGDELNRAQLRYAGNSLTATLGRQRVILDNARFVGNVGWRQDEQTLDALRLEYTPTESVRIDYSAVLRQNFIFFNANDMRSHLLNVAWQAHPQVKLSGFAYLLDFDDDAGPRVPGTPDNQTLGLRAAGRFGDITYSATWAAQSDYADSEPNVDADYLQAEVAWALGPITPRLGFEQLGGDGNYGFQTPLGTNHKFQGFADVFVAATPASGVQDVYAGAGAKIKATTLGATYHQFTADDTGSDLGTELNLSAAHALPCGVKLLAKYADYDADGFAVDTRRLWLQAAYRF